MPVITQTDIANMALDLLTEAAIDSLDEDVKAARLINRHFDVTVEAELMKNTWAFSIVSAEVTGTDLGTASGSLNWQYDLPADFLRLLPLVYDEAFEGVPISYREEGGYIYSDQASPRQIRYVANVSDPSDWSPMFTEAVAAALAIKIAHPMTSKTNMVEIAQSAYDRAISDARRVNAITKQQRLYCESWITARGDTRHWRP